MKRISKEKERDILELLDKKYTQKKIVKKMK